MSRRPGAVVLAAVLVVTLLTAGATTGVAAAASTTSAVGHTDSVSVGAATATGTVTPGDDPFTRCINGTSASVVACGYNPGPTAVSLGAQSTDGETVTVRAAALADGGYVAVHRASFVDGAFTGSLVGHTDYLAAGLHRNLTVALDEPLDESAVLYAVVYRDDGDREFEFVESDGDDDEPYTIGYTPETGQPIDEAGDVIGDSAEVTVTRSPVVVLSGTDGRYDISEVLLAIELFNRGTAIPGTGGEPLAIEDVLAIIEAFASGSDTRSR